MNQKKWLSFLSNQPENLSEQKKTAIIYCKPLLSCKKVLDVGCGEGITLSEFRKKGIFSVGLTLHKNDAVKVLVNSSNLNKVVVGDLHELPFKDDSFDGIYSKDSFEHSFAPFIASKEFSRVLKNKGKLVLVLPEENWLKEPYHFHSFSPFQLTTLLSKNSFALKQASFDLFYDFFVFEKNGKQKEIHFISLNYFFWNVLRSILKPFLKIYFSFKYKKSV